MAQKAVNQFFVVPPEDQREGVVENKELFKAHLNESFPAYEFLVQKNSPFESDDFQIIPIAGVVGDEENPGEMREMPERWVLDDIVQVCRRFNVSTSKRKLS